MLINAMTSLWYCVGFNVCFTPYEMYMKWEQTPSTQSVPSISSLISEIAFFFSYRNTESTLRHPFVTHISPHAQAQVTS